MRDNSPPSSPSGASKLTGHKRAKTDGLIDLLSSSFREDKAKVEPKTEMMMMMMMQQEENRRRDAKEAEERRLREAKEVEDRRERDRENAERMEREDRKFS